jgi:multidrug resistance protein
MTDFHSSKEVVTLGLSLYVLGLGTGPMFLAPLSEFYGRRPIFLVSWALFVIWLIPCAVAQNIQTLLISRFINGICGSAFMSVAGGTVGDLFSGSELGLPMMLYTASPFVGPELGPLVGGFINQNASWRWTYYSLIIWAGVSYLFIVILVPETFHPVVLKMKAARMRKETADQRYFAPIEHHDKSIVKTIALSCLRPIQLLTLEPMCIALCTFSAVLLGTLYLFFEAFPLVFGSHGFSLQQTGLTFLGLLVGMVAAILTNPFWDRLYLKLKLQHPSLPPPELRLPPAMLGAILVPVGLFWFAWSSFTSVHWIVPILGSAVFGVGTLLTFSGVWTFLVDAYPAYAASALAANSFLRSAFAAGFPLFADQSEWLIGLVGVRALG